MRKRSARPAGMVGMGLALLLGSAVCFAAAAAEAAPAPVLGRAQPAAQAADPLTLFTRLTPVLSSPRCFNCHGGTDPVNGVNHAGGAVGADADCQSCHTASDEWQHVSGIQFDTDTMAMCQTMRHVVQVVGPSTFVNFLASDPVVGLGFDGLRGMDEQSPFWPLNADPPPMSRADFVAAAQQWVTDGNAACSPPGWTGTIVQKVSDRSVSPGHENVKDITLTVNVNGPSSTATLHMEGHSYQDSGCSYDHETFAADGTVPAEVQVVATPAATDDGSPGYALINFGITQPIKSTTTWEKQDNACKRTAGTLSSTIPAPPTGNAGVSGGTGGAINKQVDPDQPDHLIGTDTQTSEGFTLTRTWDLTSD